MSEGVVRRWHAALNAGDLDRLVGLCSPDVELGGPRGSSHGRDALRDWVGRSGIRLEPVRLEAVGPWIVVEQDATRAGAPTQRAASVFAVADATVTRVIRYAGYKMAVDLAAFDLSRDAFIDALRRAPDVALRHRPPDEDYAVGGLVVHVIDVLERYTALIDAIRTSAWQPLTSPEGATSVEDEGLMRDGFDAVRRAGMVERLRQAHAAFSSAVAATEGDFERQADVMFAGAEGPRPTSPADVVGWVHDHYDDHAEQITSVLTDWLDSVR